MVLRGLPLLFVLASVPATTACGEQACDLSAAAALSLEIVDAETGASIVDATISYSVDGEEQDPVSGSLGDDGHYALGYELPGAYLVHVEAPGYTPVDRDYEIADGECHVESQQDTIELAPST